MKEFSFCGKGFDLLQCGEHVAVCFLFLKVQVFFLYVHDKAVYVYKVIVSLTRVFSFVCEKIAALCTAYVKACLLPGLRRRILPTSLAPMLWS